MNPDDIIQELPYNAERNVPKKRMLTAIEANKMRKHFVNYSWSDFEDEYGRIILRRLNRSDALLFVTPEDLAKLM